MPGNDSPLCGLMKDRNAYGLVGFFLVATAMVPVPAIAASCGDTIRRCECDDTVVVSTRLDRDIENCTDTGLRVAAGVTLDCGGHRIAGRSNRDGILLRFADGARVRNCEVEGFRLGIRVRGGEGQLVSDNLVRNNRRGISVGEQAKRTRIESNRVENSREIGILVNPDTAHVQVTGNTVSASGRESIDIRDAQDVVIERNILSGRPRYDIRLTDTSNALVRGNSLEGGKLQVRGDSDANRFEDNVLTARYGFDLRGSEDRDGNWRGPDDNLIHGGAILNARPCFRLAGATGTIVDDVVFGECSSRPADLKTVDGHPSIGNSIQGEASEDIRPREECGGRVSCACGGTVAESATLDSDLVGCEKFGLKLKEGVTLDCGGHAIIGRGAEDGLRLIGTRNLRIRNCVLKNFKNGIRLANTDSVLISDSELEGNRVGIRIEKDTARIAIERNGIRRSRDQGILVSMASEGLAVVGNQFDDSGREHLDVRSSHESVIDRNLFQGRARDAIRLVDVSESLIRGNEIQRAGIDLRGASRDNRFLDNILHDDGFEFRGIEERSGPWRFPNNNRIDGGAIPNARRCFAIRGASGNRIRDVELGKCADRPFDLKSVDGHEPTGNVIE